MRDDAGGVFTIDFMAAYGIFAVALAIVFFVATSAISRDLTESYAGGLRPLAEEVSDMLVLSPGSPPEWYVSPSPAGGAAFIGLSDGRPCMLSIGKISALGSFNGSELVQRTGLDDPDHRYGIRIEVGADDGSISFNAGYDATGAVDVNKCMRIVVIRDTDGTEKGGKLIVYLWRRYVGTTGTYR